MWTQRRWISIQSSKILKASNKRVEWMHDLPWTMLSWSLPQRTSSLEGVKLTERSLCSDFGFFMQHISTFCIQDLYYPLCVFLSSFLEYVNCGKKNDVQRFWQKVIDGVIYDVLSRWSRRLFANIWRRANPLEFIPFRPRNAINKINCRHRHSTRALIACGNK